MQIRLTTTGRRSGRPRTVTLYAWPDGDRLVVVGSKGGAPRDPAWAVNLRANPGAVVHVDREERPVTGREVRPGDLDRDRLWALVCDAFPLYAAYQRRTTRTIPLFVLNEASGQPD